MHEEVVISGFGGQGALFAGQLLAYTGMDEGWHVTWIPSYGPEMRGGTAHCIVIVSDEDIGSPIIRQPSTCIVMNPPSMDKYMELVKPGGLLVVNSTLVPVSDIRDDLVVLCIPANELAAEVSAENGRARGDTKMANVVLLGAMLAKKPMLSLETMEKVLDDHLKGTKRRFIEPNKRALRRGAAYVRALNGRRHMG